MPKPAPEPIPVPARLGLDLRKALRGEPQQAQSHPRYVVVDTTFSTVDMGAVAVATLRSHGIPTADIQRLTVPGFKDLAVECKRRLDAGAHIAIACGMAGAAEIDKVCAHESSLGLMSARLATNKHILECFVHMDEAKDDAELIRITHNRVSEHATNAFWLLEDPAQLVRRAGTGQRQGFEDVGAADAAKPAAARPNQPKAGRAVDRKAAKTIGGV